MTGERHSVACCHRIHPPGISSPRSDHRSSFNHVHHVQSSAPSTPWVKGSSSLAIFSGLSILRCHHPPTTVIAFFIFSLIFVASLRVAEGLSIDHSRTDGKISSTISLNSTTSISSINNDININNNNNNNNKAHDIQTPMSYNNHHMTNTHRKPNAPHHFSSSSSASFSHPSPPSSSSSSSASASSTSSSASLSSSSSSSSSPLLSSLKSSKRTIGSFLSAPHSPPPPPPYPPRFHHEDSFNFGKSLPYSSSSSSSSYPSLKSKNNDDNDINDGTNSNTAGIASSPSGQKDNNALLFSPRAAARNINSEQNEWQYDYLPPSTSVVHYSHQQPIQMRLPGNDQSIMSSSSSGQRIVYFHEADVSNTKRFHNSHNEQRKGTLNHHDEHRRLLLRMPQHLVPPDDDNDGNNSPISYRHHLRRRHTRSASSSGGTRDDVQSKAISTMLHRMVAIQTNDTECLKHSPRLKLEKDHLFVMPTMNSLTFAAEENQTLQVANFINTLYLHGNSTAEIDLYVLFALTQTIVEFSPRIKGCGLAFAKSDSSSPNMYPYSYRSSNGSIVTSEISKQYDPEKTSWFAHHRHQGMQNKNMIRSAEIFYANGELGDTRSYVKKANRTVKVFLKDGYWSEPYYDCLMATWIMQFTVAFYAIKNGLPEFKGVVMLEANVEEAPINQCAQDGSLFADSHRCPRDTTECKNIPSDLLTVGSYQCICKPGYFIPGPTNVSDYFDGKAVEKAYLDYIRNVSTDYSDNYHCVMSTPSPKTGHVIPGEETILAFDFLVRGIPLGIQSFCMTVAVVIGFVILCLRKTKVMRTSIWILLEMLIFGAILLYATVVIQYFEPTTTTCLLQPWFREMGFAIVYGVLVLKIYRILAEFQSRKAHRVHVRDKDLVKYMVIILIVVIAYMSAWTAVNMDHLEHNSTILEHLDMPDTGLSYILCRSMLWDYVIETGELLFLFCGIYLCYCIRSAPTEYSEGRYITCAIVYESVVSTLFYILRHLWWYSLHPDHLFLMYFLRCQITVTVVLFIILGPKLWYAHRPPEDDHNRSRAYSQSDVQDISSPEMMKLNVGISSNGDVEVGEISLTEMDPEDIRAELKRLYTQLQIYKTKTMRKDNPHISKRRGGRKQTHRRFSLQAFHHKHSRHHHDHDHEHEMSKTPEESTNSAEAMTFTIEPSVKEESSEGKPVPSVSFKSGHK